MPEIQYNSLKKHLDTLKKDKGDNGVAPVYLIYGEELLYKNAVEALLGVLLPDSGRSLNYEPIGGINENVPEAIQRVNTYSLLPGAKVVAIYDSKIFYSKQDEGVLLEKARAAYETKDIERAAKYFMSLLGLSNLSFDDARKPDRNRTLKLDMDRFDDDAWLDTIIDYCEENERSIPAIEDHAGVLQKALEKGFPKGNYLIITTDVVDKRRGLFKTIRETGMIIDCSVPKGDRRADRIAQAAVLNERMREILEKSGKRMDKDAYTILYEMTGFELRTFSNNLDKLTAYVGDRKKITVEDVHAVLARTKTDPLYDFTNAVTDRNIENALFYMNSLLSGGDLGHPLQLLAAILNQIRKLLVVKDFVESPHGGDWHGGASFGDFKHRIMPAIQAFDGAFLKQLEEWEKILSGNDAANSKKGEGRGPERKKKKREKSASDLVIAKNPNNPYPVYQMLIKSDRFTKQELLNALECLNAADVRFKTGGQHPKLILEEAIFRICK
jgi:DNA polymerase-3 subunit delta